MAASGCLSPRVPVWWCTPVRAGAGKITIDVEHDSVDKEAGKRIECPMLLLLAQGGPLDSFYGEDGGPGNLAAMGSAGGRTGDERRTLFPGRESR